MGLGNVRLRLGITGALVMVMLTTLIGCGVRGDGNSGSVDSDEAVELREGADGVLISGDEDDAEVDAVTEYAVYQVGQDDGCVEYQVFSCGYDSRTLLWMADETLFAKSAGYTKRILNDLDYEDIWPGVTELDFAEFELIDKGEYWLAVARFDELDNVEHVKALAERQILDLGSSEPAKPIDTDALTRLTVERGGRLLSQGDSAFGYLEF